MKKFFLTLLIAFAAVLVVQQDKHTPTPVYAANVDYFLKIEGIEGESTHGGHGGTIDVLSWSWGETQEIGLLLPAVQKVRDSAAKSHNHDSFFDIFIEVEMSSASPRLFEARRDGTSMREATLFGMREGEREPFMMIKMKPVLVSSYQTGGSSGSVPVDSFSLNFEEIKFEYRPHAD